MGIVLKHHVLQVKMICQTVLIWIVLCWIVISPSVEMIVQDQLGLRTYAFTARCFWVIGFQIGLLAIPLPASIRFMLMSTTLLFYLKTILFPIHVLLEWFRNGPRVPQQVFAARMRKCFRAHFRLHHNLASLNATPHLILANYPNDRLESFAPFMIARPFAFVIKASVDRYLRMSERVPCILVPPGGGAYAQIKQDVQAHLAAGRHVFAYVNNPSVMHTRQIDPLRSGMLRIAADLDVPVTPMAIDQFEASAGGALDEQSFVVEVGQPFFVTDVDDDVRRLREFLRRKMRRFRQCKLNS